MSWAWLAVAAFQQSAGARLAACLFGLTLRTQAYQGLEAFHAEQRQIRRNLVEREASIYQIRKALVDGGNGCCIAWVLWMP